MEPIDAAVLVLRLTTGAMIATHGWRHIFKNGKLAIEGTASWFGSMGMRQPLMQAWFASVTEIGAGALLVLGLLTSLGAAAVFGVMMVAFLIAHRDKGFFIYNPGQGWEYVGFVALTCVAIGTIGGGRVSFDHVLEIDIFERWRGLLTVVVLGGGASLGLLAAFWRPVRPTQN